MNQGKAQIRNRINSVKITYKITKAMELISSAKLKRMGSKITDIQPYYSEVYNTFHHLLTKLKNSKYFGDTSSNSKKCLWVVFNSSLGLCGGFNNNLNKIVVKAMQAQDEVFAIGAKAQSFFKSHHKNINDSFLQVEHEISYEDTQGLSFALLSKFNNNEFDLIKIAYNKYINSINIEPTIIDLLPIIKNQEPQNPQDALVITEFEPNPEKVIEIAIPLYLGAIIYGAFTESQISEQAARRLAMENASKNADEIQKELLVSYNRARQSAITQEISEIVGAQA